MLSEFLTEPVFAKGLSVSLTVASSFWTSWRVHATFTPYFTASEKRLCCSSPTELSEPVCFRKLGLFRPLGSSPKGGILNRLRFTCGVKKHSETCWNSTLCSFSRLNQAVDQTPGVKLPYSVHEIMNRWILQMGFPVVTIDTRTGNISQKHFLLEKDAAVDRKSEFKYVVKHLHCNILFLDHLKTLPISLTAVLNLSYEWFVPIKWMKRDQVQDQLWLLQKSGTLNLLKSMYLYLLICFIYLKVLQQVLDADHQVLVVMGFCTPQHGPICSRQRVKCYSLFYRGWTCMSIFWEEKGVKLTRLFWLERMPWVHA